MQYSPIQHLTCIISTSRYNYVSIISSSTLPSYPIISLISCPVPFLNFDFLPTLPPLNIVRTSFELIFYPTEFLYSLERLPSAYLSIFSLPVKKGRTDIRPEIRWTHDRPSRLQVENGNGWKSTGIPIFSRHLIWLPTGPDARSVIMTRVAAFPSHPFSLHLWHTMDHLDIAVNI